MAGSNISSISSGVPARTPAFINTHNMSINVPEEENIANYYVILLRIIT